MTNCEERKTRPRRREREMCKAAGCKHRPEVLSCTREPCARLVAIASHFLCHETRNLCHSFHNRQTMQHDLFLFLFCFISIRFFKKSFRNLIIWLQPVIASANTEIATGAIENMYFEMKSMRYFLSLPLCLRGMIEMINCPGEGREMKLYWKSPLWFTVINQWQ